MSRECHMFMCDCLTMAKESWWVSHKMKEIKITKSNQSVNRNIAAMYILAVSQS